MKILLLFFLFVFGCKEKNLLDELENGLYSLNEVYVLMDNKEVLERFDIKENDYEDLLALKSLILYEQKEILVFYKISDSLKEEIQLLKAENCISFEMDSYFYYGIDDSDIISYIKDTLNK